MMECYYSSYPGGGRRDETRVAVLPPTTTYNSPTMHRLTQQLDNNPVALLGPRTYGMAICTASVAEDLPLDLVSIEAREAEHLIYDLGVVGWIFA